MIGNGTLTLINTNTFTGGTTITAGAIQLGDGTIGHDGTLPAAGGITNNAALGLRPLSGRRRFQEASAVREA